MTNAALGMPRIAIHADGACSGNPGPGGWGAILSGGRRVKEISGGHTKTTNNRMELTAVLEALRCLKRPSVVSVYSDSRYVIDGASLWLSRWQESDWRRVKNQDLWETLVPLTKAHEIHWEWIKGHADSRLNQRADALAHAGLKRQSYQANYLRQNRPTGTSHAQT